MKKHKHQGARKIETELGTYYICDICEEKFQSWKRGLYNLWVGQRFFQGRGIVYTSWINGLFQAIQTGGMVFVLIKLATGSMPPMWIIPVLWFLQMAIETLIGIKDYKWKGAQNEGLYGFNYSPLAVEQLRRQRNIEKVLCEHLGKEYQKDSVVDLLNNKEHENK